MLQSILNSKNILFMLLMLPALIMIVQSASGRAEMVDLLHPSGEMSARLMIIAMAIAPLISLSGRKPWLRWMMARRRQFGVAGFAYALLHLVFYIIDMGSLDDMLAEALAPGIWTGWAAFVAMLIPALVSNDQSMRRLGSIWKSLQRLVYPAAVLTILHWIWVHNNLGTALAHFIPLAIIVAIRMFKPNPLQQEGVSP